MKPLPSWVVGTKGFDDTMDSRGVLRTAFFAG